MRGCILLSTVLLAACESNPFHLQVGASMMDTERAHPEVQYEDRLFGTVKVKYETERGNEVYCSHTSSISTKEEGRGINQCGFLLEL